MQQPHPGRAVAAGVPTQVPLPAGASFMLSHGECIEVLEATGVGLWRWDIPYNQIWWSPALERIHGLAAGSFGGTFESFRDLVYPADLPDVLTAYQKAIAGQRPYRIEYRVQLPNGAVRWVEASGTVLRDAQGRLSAIAGVCADITSRTQSEQHLRNSEAVYRFVAHSVPALIWMAGPDGICTFVNAGWARFTGCSSTKGLWFGWHERVHPGDLEQVRLASYRAFERHRPYQIEYRLRRSDGVYRWVVEHAVPRFSDDTQFSGFIGSIIDITGQKAAERAARMRTDEMRLMADTIPVLIAYRDAADRFRYINKAYQKWLGKPAADILNRSFSEVVGQEAYESVRQHVQEAMQGRVVTFEKDVDYPPGHKSYMRISYVPRIEQGQVQGLYVLITDLTDRRRAEEESARLAAIARDSYDAIIVMGLDCRVQSWNASAEQIFGYASAEAVGRHVSLLTPPERRQETCCLLDRAHNGERIVSFETVFVRKDGSAIHVSLTISPIYNAAGELVATSTIGRNITQQKRGEERARFLGEASQILGGSLDYEQNLQNLATRCVSGMADWCAIDLLRGASTLTRAAVAYAQDGAPPIVNQSECAWEITVGHGLGPGAAILKGAPLCAEHLDSAQAKLLAEDLHDPALMVRCLRAYICAPIEAGGKMLGAVTWALFQPGRNYSKDDGATAMELARRAGLAIENARHFQAAQSELALRRAYERRLKVLNRTLDQRVKERTRKLEEQQARLRELLNELSVVEQRERQRLSTELHDYLAQLIVAALLTVKEYATDGPPDSREPPGAMHEVRALLEEALEYTRTLTAELTPSVLQESGLAAAIKWLAKRLEYQGLSTQVAGHMDGFKLPDTTAALMFSCVRELLFNVLKHSGAQCARVELETEERALAITVADDGRGFNLEALNLAAAGGHFGLKHVHRRVAGLGGEMLVESAPGNGARVRLRIPFALRPGAPGGLGKHGSEVSTPGADAQSEAPWPIRVLIADDHAIIRESIRAAIEGRPEFEVICEAADGAEAVEKALELQPDVVLMDVSMPEMSGIEATAAIKAQAPDIRIIGHTVHDSAETARAMAQAGAERLLLKGESAKTLFAALRMGRRCG